MDSGSYNFFILGEFETRLTIDNLKDFGSSKLEEVCLLIIEAAF
jgi:hypothetical protein